jgi:hypothetical protein
MSDGGVDQIGSVREPGSAQDGRALAAAPEASPGDTGAPTADIAFALGSTLLAGFGRGWKGVGGALGKPAGTLEQPLWGAVLDVAIADAITLRLGNKADALGRPALATDLAPRSRRANPDRTFPNVR